MTYMYVPKYFSIEEFIPVDVYINHLDKSWEFMDERLLVVADKLRERFGKATINDWKWGGDYYESGLRVPNMAYYKPHSQHSFGRAIDIKFSNYEPPEVIQDIVTQSKSDKDYYLGLVGGVELGTATWVHVDVRCRRTEGILVFSA